MMRVCGKFGLAALFVFLAVAVRAAGLSLEWLLLTGSTRDRLVDVLLLEERFDELDFLMSAWEGDEWGAEARNPADWSFRGRGAIWSASSARPVRRR